MAHNLFVLNLSRSNYLVLRDNKTPCIAIGSEFLCSFYLKEPHRLPDLQGDKGNRFLALL